MDKGEVAVTHPSKLKALNDQVVINVKKFGIFLFDRESREVLGRDGLSWAKISLFYFVFYAILASIFVGFLAVFASTLDRQVPRYYSDTSIMTTRNQLNPGLGFRPQVDPEDNIIFYEENAEKVKKLTKYLRQFLTRYYDERIDVGNSIENCENKDLNNLREKFFKDRSYCDYDYEKVLDSTTCEPSNDFGYISTGPCVAVKLNRIYDWKPSSYESLDSLPFDKSLILNSTNILKNNIFVICDGEYGTDRDALRKSKIKYFSANSKVLNISNIGLIPFYYYPYLNQPGYKSPLVFVQYENLPKNQLINIMCKAYASNIDSDDKLNLRGMVKYQLFIEKGQ